MLVNKEKKHVSVCVLDYLFNFFFFCVLNSKNERKTKADCVSNSKKKRKLKPEKTLVL